MRTLLLLILMAGATGIVNPPTAPGANGPAQPPKVFCA